MSPCAITHFGAIDCITLFAYLSFRGTDRNNSYHQHHHRHHHHHHHIKIEKSSHCEWPIYREAMLISLAASPPEGIETDPRGLRRNAKFAEAWRRASGTFALQQWHWVTQETKAKSLGPAAIPGRRKPTDRVGCLSTGWNLVTIKTMHR